MDECLLDSLDLLTELLTELTAEFLAFHRLLDELQSVTFDLLAAKIIQLRKIVDLLVAMVAC